MSMIGSTSENGRPDPGLPLRVVLRGGLGSQLFNVYAGFLLSALTLRPLEVDVTQLAPDLLEHDEGVLHLNLPGTLVFENTSTSWRRLRAIKRAIVGEAALLTPLFSRASQLAFNQIHKHQPNLNALTLSELTKLSDAPVLDGFYLSWEIAAQARAHGLSNIIRPKQLSPHCQALADRIRSERLAVVHIRRGDYVSLKERFGLLTERYYSAAYERLRMAHGPMELLCFSDDPNAAQEILRRARVPFTLADPELGLNSAETLWSMSQSAWHIVSNSSLSWHAAFWSSHPALVICPQPLYIDTSIHHALYAPTWLLIPSHFSTN